MKLAKTILAVLMLLFFFFEAQAQTPPDTTLRSLADKTGYEIGSGIYETKAVNSLYVQTLIREYNLMLIDGGVFNWSLGPKPFRPDLQTFDFSSGDYLVNLAQQYNMKARGQHLVWGYRQTLPSWLLEGGYTKAQLLDILRDHINQTVSHYKGKIKQWSIANEYTTRQHGLFGGDFWFDNIGPEYVEESFRWAREADPDAQLILNDFANESINTISDEMYNLIRDFKAKGVPIDGIGMQMHLQATNPPQKAEVIQNMQRFGDLGIKVYVTEFDVKLDKLTGTQQEKWNIQAQIYKNMFEACIESQVCQSFTSFWLTDGEILGDPAEEPAPFDVNFNPKPAYYALRDALAALFDVNNDALVNVLDIQACVNHILGTQDYGTRADINGDGSVNVLDVQAIVNIILKG